MAIENEELLEKLVRTGMIMRHIDGEGPHPRHRKHEKGQGREHSPQDASFEIGSNATQDHDPNARSSGNASCSDRGNRRRKRRGQARVLSMVALQEGITQKDLAFLLGIRPQTLGEMLQKLEERGLIERRKSAADGRAVEVSLTDEGRTRAAEIAKRRKLAAADIFATLTDDEKTQLVTILDKLDAELDKHRPKPVDNPEA